jgi:DNA-binding Lrp family transcriptional regulator
MRQISVQSSLMPSDDRRFVESPDPSPGPDRRIDAVDHALIRALLEDGRMSLTDLADVTHVSRSTVHARVQRLRDEGVITGFSATIDHAAVGLAVAALVLIDIEQHDWRMLRDQLLAVPGVEYLAMCAGRFDLIMLVRAPTIAALRDVLLEDVQRLDGVRSTETVLILDEARA